MKHQPGVFHKKDFNYQKSEKARRASEIKKTDVDVIKWLAGNFTIHQTHAATQWDHGSDRSG